MQIGNTVIANNLRNIDFSKLKTGDQILLIKNKFNKKINRNINKFEALMVNEILTNKIILLQKNLIDYELTFNNKQPYFSSDNNFEQQHFLLVDNKPIKIYIESIYDFFNGYSNKYLNKFNELIRSNKDMFYTFEYGTDNEQFNYYFTCNISDNLYFCYLCNNEIIDYNWTLNEHIYLINFNDRKYYILNECDINKLLKALSKSHSNLYLDKFKEAYKIIQYDVEDYLKNKDSLNDVIDFYLNIPFLEKSDIEKFFKPIYENEDFKSYFSSRYESKILNENICISNKNKLKLNKRITDSIKEYLLQYSNNKINPYTGELISNDYEKVYEDSEHLMIQNKYLFDHIKYYKKHNNVFIEADYKEELEIKDLKETIDKLTS